MSAVLKFEDWGRGEVKTSSEQHYFVNYLNTAIARTAAKPKPV